MKKPLNLLYIYACICKSIYKIISYNIVLYIRVSRLGLKRKIQFGDQLDLFPIWSILPCSGICKMHIVPFKINNVVNALTQLKYLTTHPLPIFSMSLKNGKFHILNPICNPQFHKLFVSLRKHESLVFEWHHLQAKLAKPKHGCRFVSMLFSTYMLYSSNIERQW